MSAKHNHSSSSEHEHHHEHRHGPLWRRLHRDWRVWLAVVLMLAAMFAYVMSNDESLQPGGQVRQSMPAAE
jgi:hypothetical protein